MAASNYIFVGEIEHFDIDDYVAHLGWIGRGVNYLKIYTQPGTSLFCLHDEIQDRMYVDIPEQRGFFVTFDDKT
nr:hypothetical protein [uncultured Dyadobacter sp.]